MTQAEFGKAIACIGATATSWVTKAFGRREEWNAPVDAEKVATFLSEMRQRLDNIQAQAVPATSITPEA